MDDLPNLSRRQREFLNFYLSGDKVIDCYKKAYKPTNTNVRTLYTASQKVKSSESMQAHIKWHEKRANIGSVRAVEDHIAELTRLRELGVTNAQISPAVQAEIAAAKVSGLYETNINIKHEVSDLELIKVIQVSLGDDAARAISSALGLPAPDSLDVIEEMGEQDFIEVE